jgi:hypothetical protein
MYYILKIFRKIENFNLLYVSIYIVNNIITLVSTITVRPSISDPFSSAEHASVQVPYSIMCLEMYKQFWYILIFYAFNLVTVVVFYHLPIFNIWYNIMLSINIRGSPRVHARTPRCPRTTVWTTLRQCLSNTSYTYLCTHIIYLYTYQYTILSFKYA